MLRNLHGSFSQKEAKKRRHLELHQRFFVREQTYKSMEAEWRAFYKFVCKQGWYWLLVYNPGEQNRQWWHPRGTNEEHILRRTDDLPSWYGFSGRYPTYRNWRSQAYEDWNKLFLKHRQRWEEEAKAKRVRDYKEELKLSQIAFHRARLQKEKRERKKLHSRATVGVFRMLAAVSTIDG